MNTSMFSVTGQVLHVFDAPPQVSKETGEVTQEGKHKVQILGDLPLPNGQTRKDMITLSCEDRGEFEALQGQTVSVPVGFFAPSKGAIVYFIPKGGHPLVVSLSSAGSVPGALSSRVEA